MTDIIIHLPKAKLSRRALQEIRRARTMAAGSSYGIGGLPKKYKPAPINLRLPKDQR